MVSSDVFNGVRALGLDLDQTMYQDTPAIQTLTNSQIYQSAAYHLHLSVPEAKQRYERAHQIEGSGRKAFERLGIPDGAKEFLDCIDRADTSVAINSDPALVRLLTKAKDRFEYVFLVTNSRTANGTRKLAALGFTPDFFHPILFYDTTKHRKRDGNVFRYVMELTGLEAEQHAYVGDREKEDILPARAVGFKTIKVGDEKSTSADLWIPEIHSIEDHFDLS